MIPKRQHMEQTTDGTISYLLSISWSHLSSTSAKPSSWLVEVMVTEVEGAGFRRRGWYTWPQRVKGEVGTNVFFNFVNSSVIS